ncbi:hypothetical protein HK097_001635 [Rhizophlyctis rosea]|uniref:Uncharacterized protein n=1 Tax=Rhizophlyctis rosea TaxID=64517 RepID=A0AAD5SGU4_9FUNG|nr:hypothetical protein HK097_001635 [Rhizophlyctis rosea]
MIRTPSTLDSPNLSSSILSRLALPPPPSSPPPRHLTPQPSTPLLSPSPLKSTTASHTSPPRLPVTPQSDFEIDVMLSFMLGEVGEILERTAGSKGALGEDDMMRSRSLPRGMHFGGGVLGLEKEVSEAGSPSRRPKSTAFTLSPPSTPPLPSAPGQWTPPNEWLLKPSSIPVLPEIPGADGSLKGSGKGESIVPLPNALPVAMMSEGGSGSADASTRAQVGKVEIGVKRERSNDDILLEASGRGDVDSGRRASTLGRTVKRFLRRPSMPNLRELF